MIRISHYLYMQPYHVLIQRFATGPLLKIQYVLIKLSNCLNKAYKTIDRFTEHLSASIFSEIN